MEISIGSYKFRLEILILIVVVFWIMFGHVLCSCCRVSMFEGLTTIAGTVTPGRKIAAANLMVNNNQATTDTSSTTTTEGFVGANNVASGPEFAGAKTPDYIMNPSTWARPTLTYSPGTKPDAAVKAIWDRPKQPIPLPEGQLFFWETTPFKPECCPSYMSSSMGCACMTVDQYNYLRDRGGNNVPYSEY
jgi:hypothetical protein